MLGIKHWSLIKSGSYSNILPVQKKYPRLASMWSGAMLAFADWASDTVFRLTAITIQAV